MRLFWLVILTLFLGLSTVCAQDARSSRREQIDAATARAVDGLHRQIGQESLGRNVTVNDLLDRTSSHDELDKTLQRAQMIGGPRWIDDQTCQVRLEISGPRVATALINIASTKPKKSPIAPEVLTARVKDWDRRTFSATGTSTAGAAAGMVKPTEDGVAWSRVNDATRQQAINAAKQDAAHRVIETIKPLPWGTGGKTVADALADKDVRDAVDQWLATRPVNQVEFREDLQVRVALATPAGELSDVLHDAAAKNPELSRVMDDAAWTKLGKDLADRVSATTRGGGRVGATPLSVTRMSIGAPDTPRWVNDQADAVGAAAPAKSPLKAARAAEADAQAKLRQKLELLPLSDGITLGDAGKQNPRIADAIGRSLSRARPTKVDYLSDGGARVRLTLELRDLWDELQPAL
jgi:hypothetical protein